MSWESATSGQWRQEGKDQGARRERPRCVNGFRRHAHKGTVLSPRRQVLSVSGICEDSEQRAIAELRFHWAQPSKREADCGWADCGVPVERVVAGCRDEPCPVTVDTHSSEAKFNTINRVSLNSILRTLWYK